MQFALAVAAVGVGDSLLRKEKQKQQQQHSPFGNLGFSEAHRDFPESLRLFAEEDVKSLLLGITKIVFLCTEATLGFRVFRHSGNARYLLKIGFVRAQRMVWDPCL